MRPTSSPSVIAANVGGPSPALRWVDLEVVGPAELRDAAAHLARRYTAAVATG